MPRVSRFLLFNSDRSGFKHFRIELVKDGPWIVQGEEFDQPPPSRIPLGGEADLSAGELRTNSDFSGNVALVTGSASGLDNPTVYVTAAGGVTPTYAHPWMRVTGSNAAITVTAVPQIVRGKEGSVLTLQCVDSSITLTQGSANAINFMDSRGTLQLSSGVIVTFVFNTSNQAWNEASRARL